MRGTNSGQEVEALTTQDGHFIQMVELQDTEWHYFKHNVRVLVWDSQVSSWDIDMVLYAAKNLLHDYFSLK